MINIDTNKLKKSGNDIIKLSQDLQELYNSMYDRINNMPTVTGEWLGNSAIEYAKNAMKEKIEVVDFKNQLYTFGDIMVKCANHYEDTTIKTI